MLLPSRFRAAHPGHRAAYQAKPRVRAMGTTSDLWGQRADGTEFPVDLALGPLETDGGTLVSCVVRDITERKRAQRDLQEKNLELVSANQAKDRFLANMTHELRTPLNAILGFTGTLLMKLPGPLTAEQEKQLRTVQESATHLLELISTVLELSKIDIGGMKLFPEPVDLRKVVEEVCAVVAPLATARRIAVRTAIAPEAGTVTLDPRMFKQILFNLLTNAVKFSDVGACVDVAANRSDTGSLRLQVRDTGIGIAPGDLDKLFVEFQQLDAGSARRHEGTGLGLAITRGLVECQGGSIAVESAPGRGTTFTVVLPLRPGREGA
jgi:protein-histidine pros-kinase